MPFDPDISTHTQSETLPDTAVSAYLDSLLRGLEEPESTTGPGQQTPEQVNESPERVEEQAPARASDQPGSQVMQNGDVVEVLAFTVSDLRFAVRLTELDRIVEIHDEATQVPEQPGWSLGLVRDGNTSVSLVDTAKLLMPERERRHDAGVCNRGYSHALLFGDRRWALACDGIDVVMSLEHEQVRWCRTSASRPWLAGTVIDRMCALLDLNALQNNLK